MDPDKRLTKEAFVSDLTGTTVGEVNVIATLPALLLFITQLLANNRSPRFLWMSLWIEYAVLVIPLMVQLMGPFTPRAVMMGSSLASLFLVISQWKTLKRQWSTLQMLTMRQALSAHRSGVMLLTCISILAVDFHAFPRRFGKAETFGTGLMDAGVGSIVVASAFATGLRSASASGTAGYNRLSSLSSGSLKRNLVRLAALVALGMSRPIITSVLGYQSHVGEYGMHWNFFLTLAALRLLSMVVPGIVIASPILGGAAGVFILIWHQWRLSHGLIHYVHSNDRGSDLLSLNKEGIYSLPGYFALHLLGCACGAFLEETAGPRSVKSGQRLRILSFLALFWMGFVASASWIEPVSRRACNATYVLWILSLNFQSLVCIGAVVSAVPSLALPSILMAVNDTMLPTFLIANVFTGLFNLIFDTMKIGDVAARMTVAVYMAFVLCFAVLIWRWMSTGQKAYQSHKFR